LKTENGFLYIKAAGIVTKEGSTRQGTVSLFSGPYWIERSPPLSNSSFTFFFVDWEHFHGVKEKKQNHANALPNIRISIL